MKQAFFLISISILLAAFSVKKFNPKDITQLVMVLPQLSNPDIKEMLETDFNNKPGVIKCEVSLMTKTLLINYNEQKVSSGEIFSVLDKWECSPGKYDYQKLY